MARRAPGAVPYSRALPAHVPVFLRPRRAVGQSDQRGDELIRCGQERRVVCVQLDHVFAWMLTDHSALERGWNRAVACREDVGTGGRREQGLVDVDGGGE